MMIKKTESNGSVTDNPRDSGQELQDDEDIYEDPVRLLGQKMGFYHPTTCNNSAKVNPFSMAACVRNFSVDEHCIMEESLMMSQRTTQQDLNTRLLESIPGGNTALMSRIIAKGASPNATCRQSNVSACHLAAMYDNDALELLLTKGADSSRRDRQGRTPLHLAAWAGNVKHIAVLLNFPEALRKSVVDHVLSLETLKAVSRHSLPVNELTNVPCRRNGWSTLPNEQCDGVEYNCRKIKEILGVCCSRLVPKFREGFTPLHAASGRAHHHCVQLLLAAGADPNAQHFHSRTALDVAGGAYYFDHKSIDVNNFVETVGLLLKAGGKFLKSSEDVPNNTPLHVAVELGSEAAVKQLLQAGASATVWNKQGLTAMHVCVEKRNKVLLQLLANHKSRYNPSLVTVDVKDRTGSTVLCAAVEAKWIQGVCLALDAGASIATKAYEKSPMHIAAQWGNIVILQKILNVAQDRNINYSNEERSTALLNAISNNQRDALELLFKNGFSIDIVYPDESNVFHIATKLGRKEILSFLLGYDENITNKLINMPDHFGPPLYYAIQNNHPDCAALLISKGAQVDVRGDYDGCAYWSSTLLHAAARKNRCKIAEMIISNDSKTVHATSGGPLWTPLHEACRKRNREMIMLLLRKGADLSGECNAEKKSRHCKLLWNPIQLLMSKVSKPTELIQEVFNSCISSQEDENCSITDNRITVDYTVLNPPCENVERSQMRVIQALLDSGNTYDQQRLLLHPLVESFLFLQWKSSLPFFYSLLALHVCFVLSLNVFALSLFWCKDRKVEPKSYILFIVIFFMYFSILIITMQEIIFIKQKGIRNLRCMETWLRFLSTLLAIILPVIVSWNSESQAEWVRFISGATLFFSWVKIMLLVSRFPKFGYYVLMYEQVARRVMIILVPLGCLIIGFSVSFMIQFHAQPPFEDPWSSLLMTMVMMSEPGYKDTVNKDHESASLIMLRLIFVVFFFLCSIVLMNMLVSVAVNDVKDLEVLGHKKRLEKQVEFITAVEGTAPRNFVKKILPKHLYEKWFKFMQVENGIQNFRGGSVNGYLCWCRLPVRLREAFLEKAQSQKKRSDKNQDTNMYHMKLNEIQKVVVKNDKRILEAVNRMFEEICKLRRENAGKLSLSKDEGTAI